MKHTTFTITATTTTTVKTSQVNQLQQALLDKFGTGTEFDYKGTSDLDQHGLKTRQDPTRIFAYYLKDLIELGFLVKNITVTEPEQRAISKISQIRALAEKIIASGTNVEDAQAILDLASK